MLPILSRTQSGKNGVNIEVPGVGFKISDYVSSNDFIDSCTDKLRADKTVAIFPEGGSHGYT